MKYLYGLHDPGGEHLFADAKGWIVFTEATGHDPNNTSGRDYRQWSDAGYGVLVRLNNGYGSAGTIPLPNEYGNFARRVAHFIANSKGCDTWIVGNEPNHSQERPDGQTITPALYTVCFRQVYAAVRDIAGTRHALIPAPVAPWNRESGDWLEYHNIIWRDLWQLAGGVVLHAYTHGPSPSLLSSEERVQGWHWHFRTYRDQLGALPERARGLPVYITESNQGDNAWVDANTGWVQAAYAEIDAWNKVDGTQKIHCLCLYRWPAFDRWGIVNKPGVHADLRAAVGRGYTSPARKENQMPDPVPSSPPTNTKPAPDMPREWDERLTQRGVTIETPPLQPGQDYWRVVRARWFNEQEAGGRHHIYVEALDRRGVPIDAVPFEVFWPTGRTTGYTRTVGGFDAGNVPMSPSLNEFGVGIDTEYQSETVKGIGMGADGNPGVHTSTLVTFQLATVGQSQKHETHLPTVGTGPQPAPAIAYVNAPAGLYLRSAPKDGAVLVAIPFAEQIRITGVGQDGWVKVRYGQHEGWAASAYISLEAPAPLPQPAEPTPQPTDTWQRSRAFIAKWEGGYQNVRNDAGNWTGCEVGKGELKGTKYGISACSYPHLDIANITKEQADAIYFTDYWQRSGASNLPWPLCLMVLDTAVLHGVGTAQAWLGEVGPNPYVFAARRLRSYTKQGNWDFWGKAWTSRVADLLEEVGSA